MEENQSAPSESIEPVKGRIVSVDVLRGFDMFWIVGGGALFASLFKLMGGPFERIFVPQLDHAEWQGFHFYDLIFPLFAFIVGMSVVFSLEKLLRTQGKKAAYKRVLRRFIILYLLGIIYYGGIGKGFENIRLMGVLQRLAFVYLFSGLLFINFRLKGLIIAFASILLAYWAFLSFVPIPGQEHVSFEPGLNWTNWIDEHYLPLFKWDGRWDPEGILSTIPAIGTGLLGVFASLLLRVKSVEDKKKVIYFIGGGFALVVLGYLWGLQFPVIKKIWTSSYVLVAGGYSLMLLGLFFLIVDVWKIQKWAVPFVWIGMNPITIYLTVQFFNFQRLAAALIGNEKIWGSLWGNFFVATVYMILVFLFLRFMFKKKIFIRI